MQKPNYKGLYYALAAEVADTIERLTQKQLELEDIYINQGNEELENIKKK